MAAPASLARLAQIAALQRFVSLSADEQSCPTAILRNEGDRTVVVVVVVVVDQPNTAHRKKNLERQKSSREHELT